MRMRKSVRVKKPAHVKKSSRLTGAIGRRSIVLVAICVLGAAVLIGARQPSEAPDTIRADANTQPVAPAPGLLRKPASKGSTADAVMGSTLGSDETGVNGTASPSAAAKPASVTLTGCLERDDRTFRLKDTSGEAAPKSRSWKSGFLKKSPASLEVVDASHTLKLPSHVGQRVSVTGVIADREMRVRSLQRVAASCNASPQALEH
jgi:hypothetical protein